MRRTYIIFIFLVLIAMVIGIITLTAPSFTHRPIRFTIAPGENVHSVSRHLKNAGLIRSSFTFETLVWLMNGQRFIHAGTYDLSTDQPVSSIVMRFIGGRQRANQQITFIEGWNLKDYKRQLSDAGFDVTSFDAMTTKSNLWSARYPFVASLSDGRTLEGYLFPDTYAISVDRQLEPLIRKMLENFNTKVSRSLRDAFEARHMALDDAIILASIVEREVPDTQDRKKVADIFLRRLQAKMPLQSDATVDYITGSSRTRATAQDIAVDSPYNTYRIVGLPPGPIGNPGIDAISAVANPQPNDYLFFLTDAQGTVHYAKTFEEHKRNKQMYLLQRS